MMERALHSLLTPKENEMVIRLSEPFPLPSDHGGDVSIAISNMWLMKYGMMLEPVTNRYKKKGGLLYNLLQDLDSRLVIKVVLTMCDGGIANHFIAYDGLPSMMFPIVSSHIAMTGERKATVLPPSRSYTQQRSILPSK